MRISFFISLFTLLAVGCGADPEPRGRSEPRIETASDPEELEERERTRHAARLRSLEADLSGSDDWTAHRGEFVQAGAFLLRDFGCRNSHFRDQGGFVRSTTASNQYFIYCGDYDRIDVTLMSENRLRIAKRNGRSRIYEIDPWSPDEFELAGEVARLLERLSTVPESDFMARRDIYRELVELRPDDEFFMGRLAHYQELDRQDEQRLISGE